MKFISTIILLFISLSIQAIQVDNLPTKTVDGKKVYIYNVKKGDGWLSIARKFDISLAELKLANKKADKLNIGAPINIPATKLKLNDPARDKNHIDKAENKPERSTATAKVVKHKVASGETLFAISKKYNLSVDKIKAANNLKSNSIHKGQVLLINPSENTAKENSSEVKEVVVEKKEEKKDEKKENIVSKESVPTVITKEAVIAKKEEENKSDSDKNNSATADVSDRKIVFANGRQEINETGVASWIDGQNTNSNKYYALHKTAPLGTIIKITNRMNSKMIYVKVVGRLPDTGENEGILIKVSKAGADKLGVIDERFQAQLVYGVSENK